VLFLPRGACGVLVLAVTLLRPGVAAMGLVAVTAAYAFAWLIRLDESFREYGFYFYNPLLVGLSVGYWFQFTPEVVLLAAIAGTVTLSVCVVVSYVLRTYLNLPVLSLPFVLTSSLVYVASLRYAGLAARAAAAPLWLPATGPCLPGWAEGFFVAFGAVFFTPDAIAGAVLAGLVLYYSRILFLLAVLGYSAGVGVRALLLNSTAAAFADPSSFNFLLVAMALGGVFLVPSIRSYLVAVVGAVAAALVLDAVLGLGEPIGLPPLALPLNVVILGTVGALGLAGYPKMALLPGRTPEETLENDVVARLRYSNSTRMIYLPFSGTWTVWQGFDGRWTHRGPWRFAYDFVITDDDGHTYQGDGTRPEDYYGYGKPVLSPTEGRIVRVIRHLPDGPIGSPPQGNNWGNLVVIEDPRGFFVELSHFAADSIRVAEGDEVRRGTVLGLCGNSGYSPQPHIHVQVQADDRVATPTLPFRFAAYVVGKHYHSDGLPAENRRVEPAWPDGRLDAATSFHLDQVVRFDVSRDGESVERAELTVKMAPDGTFYFESNHGGRLYFGKHLGTLTRYRLEGNDSALRLLMLALPRLPLACREGLAWEDWLPAGVVCTGVRRLAARLAIAFWPELAAVRVASRFRGRGMIETTLRSRPLGIDLSAGVQFDARMELSSVCVGRWRLERVAEDDDGQRRGIAAVVEGTDGPETAVSKMPVQQDLHAVLELD